MCDPFNMPDCQKWHDKRSTFTLEERKGRKYIGRNKARKELALFDLDGCLIESSKLKKADHVFLICEEKKAYFVELKGSDLIKAVRQMSSSLDELLENLKGYGGIYGRIVLSRVRSNDTRNAELSRLMKRFRELGGNLIYKTRIIEENL